MGTEPAEWGAALLGTIRREYYISESRLYAERPDRVQPAFNWGVGVMLSALNAAARHDPAYKPWLREFADSSRVYWNQGGYDVLPVPKPFDRYYDDNAWMALALVETYEVLGDKKYLEWAEGALDYALSGESAEGGVFWRESDKLSRNTCSNAPTAAACLAVYRHTQDASRVEHAERLVEWTRKVLQDPSDGLFWDSVAAGGTIDRTKWSYNTALMLRAMRGLGQETSAVETASKKRWLQAGGVNDPGRFAHLLLEAWLDVGGFREEATRLLETQWARRSQRGFVPGHWLKPSLDERPELLDQAAFARACFVVAGARS